MANVERNKPYILSEIIKETGLPVLIRKEAWSPGFVFRVDKVENGTAYGTAFKNGVEHKRKFGAYTYSLNEQFCLAEIPKSQKDIEAQRAAARLRVESASEMAAEKKESDAELARLSISDVVRTRGRVTERKFLPGLFSGNYQANIEEEEKYHISRIVRVIEGIIEKIRASITRPDKPSWNDFETGPGGTQISLSGSEYFSEMDRNAARHTDVATMQRVEKKPYFCHLSLQFEGEDEPEDVFVGEKLVYDQGMPTVVSWQSPIGALANDKTRTSIRINGRFQANVQFKRNVVIQNGILSSAVETYNRSRRLNEKEEAIVYDEFLLKVLKEKRQHKELTNIIPSIQQNQNQIIRAAQKENIIVQGCAGCGKTMILLHRISYLLYNHPGIQQSKYLVLSPSRQFNEHLLPLLDDLQISSITVRSVAEYYIECLCAYNTFWKELEADERLYADTNIDPKAAAYFYSEEYAQKLRQRVDRRVQALRENERMITKLSEQRKELKDAVKDTREIQNEIERRKNLRRISIFDEQFLDILPKGMRPGNRKKPICKAELYATLLVNYYCYGMKNTFPYVFVDEGQDLSLAEYLLIRSMNRNAVFNIYGDMDQRISDYSIGSWEALNTVGTFSKYTINENYRNTMQITEFVNDELFMSMVGMGLEGVEVDLQPTSQISKERQIASLGDRKAIIYKDEEALTAISEDLSGYDVYTVREAKGMEFETVLVIPNGMTDNELYVAYTRALNRLFLLDV
ncbi:MAG: AAA family ATPase [Clostridia bacterium]|nr:AAA family ATPase [Clostridia bacterium]